MADVIDFNAPSHVPHGWQFVNLFYDVRKQLFYCRIRKLIIGAKFLDLPEVTGAGATANIAMHNANQLTGTIGNA